MVVQLTFYSWSLQHLYIYIKRTALMRINVVLEILKLKVIIDSYGNFSECQLIANGIYIVMYLSLIMCSGQNNGEISPGN